MTLVWCLGWAWQGPIRLQRGGWGQLGPSSAAWGNRVSPSPNPDTWEEKGIACLTLAAQGGKRVWPGPDSTGGRGHGLTPIQLHRRRGSWLSPNLVLHGEGLGIWQWRRMIVLMATAPPLPNFLTFREPNGPLLACKLEAKYPCSK